jgi:hypothetical protein
MSEAFVNKREVSGVLSVPCDGTSQKPD